MADSLLPRGTLLVCVLLLLVSGLVLATGRDLGHRVAFSVCGGSEQCGDFPDSPPVCQYFGRDRVAAQESFVFAQQRAADGARLTQFGDDSATVIIGAEDGSSGTLYSFAHWREAQRWVLDHSAELGAVVDAAAGPAGQPVRDGYLQTLRLTGLDHEVFFEPQTAVHMFQDELVPGAEGALRGRSGAAAEEVTVVMPLSAVSDELAELSASLGFWGYLSYTVELDDELNPVSLSFSGPAAEGWSLQSLRLPSASEFRDAESRPLLGVDEGIVSVRSFTLDLQRQSNAALYRQMFSMGPVAQLPAAAPRLIVEDSAAAEDREDLYGRMRERIREDALAVEAVHQLPGPERTEQSVLDAARGLMVRSVPEHLSDTRLTDARTADLAVAGSQLEPLLSCEQQTEDEENR